MTLSTEEIIEIIKSNPNKASITEAIKQHNELNMHVNAVGVHEHLASLKDYETDLQIKVGSKIIESNKGLYNSLLNPTTKVFSAKGGTKRYELPNSSKDKFREELNNVAHGLNVRKWLEKKIFNKYITDPNGIIFIEVENENPKATFKSITSIYDYKLVGQKVEYVVFNPFKKDEDSDKFYYRVVDDLNDYIFEKDNDTVRLIEEETFENHFNECPAIVVSDIFDDVSGIKSSFVSNTLEKANKFLYDNSVHSKHKLLFGFSKYWEYGITCNTCSGEGVVRGEDGGEVECSSCHGTGVRSLGDVTDKRVIPLPIDKESPVLKEFSGHETPDLDIWKQYKEDLKDHKKELYKELWNVNYTIESQGQSKTATEAVIDVQPINDKLHSVTDNFEKLEKFVTDLYGVFHYESQYKGSSINYGRRYLIESPDVLWKKLCNAKAEKMPYVFLINLTKEYIQSLYANNEEECAIQMKLLKIEPFVFMTIDEVVKLNIDSIEKKKKIYFQEWYKSKSETQLLLGRKEELEKDLEVFINTKSYKDETKKI
ncbi:hypothetical protein BTO06_09835 [Tenacibaculum sp. SZ-18]|uniref:zinc finger-like domain-containing protein n=1 Tax=Tenacibaculum sp. SZ-18 TaxID=754423 RepID=UPI000C2D103D|nr:zinc finger-like domain-containing protein [Tenacibaculum sp. SZ-18]AUC15420.1 hypothetical protein BTO06_09835 [Tenacibaculum sp. SZ-18]